MDDQELLKRYAKDGDDGAFTQLVERYIGMVFGTARRRTGNRELAEEIAQNVFAILARKATKLKPGTVVSGWLHRTVVLQSAHVMRTEQRRTTHMKEFSETLVADDAEPLEPHVWNDVVQVLDESMDQLDPQDRNVLFLRFCEERNLREVGDLLGKSESATQRHANRALEKLGSLLRKKGVVVPTTTLAAGLTAELGKAATAPVGMAASVSKFALSGAINSATTATTLTTITLMMTQLKTTTLILAGFALVALFTGGGMLLGHLSDTKETVPTSSDVVATKSEDVALRTSIVDNVDPIEVPEPEPASPELNEVAVLLAKAMTLAKEASEPKDAKAAIRELLADLAADEMSEAFAYVSEQSGSRQIREFMEKELFRRWGSLDPTKAKTHALDTESAGARADHASAVAEYWAENDPDAAYSWYNAAREGSDHPLGSGALQEVLGDLTEGWIRHDVDDGFRMLESLDFDEQTAARASIDDFARDPARREEVSDRILQIQDPQLLASVVHDFGAKWAKDDPRSAASWFDQIEFEDSTTAFRSGNLIGEGFFEQYPREAVDWFFPKVPDEMREHFLKGLVGGGWAQRDRAAASQWLQDNGFNPDEIIQSN